MNLKPNKHKRISFNTTTMASLGFIAPTPKILVLLLNLAPPAPKIQFFAQAPPPPKIRGAATMMVLKNRVCLSFRSSFHLYVSFLGIGSLFFSETQHAVRGPSIVICDSWIFWKTSLFGKMTKMVKNDAKKGFWIMSLVLSGICVK